MDNKAPDPLNTSEHWMERLQEAGYRLTTPRRAVVEIIVNSEYLLDPQNLFDQARQHYPKLGLVTVYRTLEKLEELGLVQRVHHPDGCQAFIAAVSGHTHLLICQRCSRVQYFSGDSERMDRLMTAVSQESGYVIRDHWLQLFGLCQTCQASTR
jgi:Fur family transcriptional regulator, ferric uptake regulator